MAGEQMGICLLLKYYMLISYIRFYTSSAIRDTPTYISDILYHVG